MARPDFCANCHDAPSEPRDLEPGTFGVQVSVPEDEPDE